MCKLGENFATVQKEVASVEDVLARMVKQERLRAVSMKMYTADNQRQPLASGSDVLEKMFPALQKMGALRI